MPPQSKRRRLSLLTLPVVVAASFLLVAKLTAWKRSDLIAGLTDRISHADTRDAMEAVHALAVMPNPPVSVLVTAAASDDRQTAGAAQVAIDRLLQRWQLDAETEKHYRTIAGQLSKLATSLAEKRSKFSDANHAWLESAVRRILRIANMFPAAKTPLVAVHCDKILTAIGAGHLPTKPRRPPRVDDFDGAIAGMPDGKLFSQPGFAPLSDAVQEASQSSNEKARPVESVLVPLDPPTTTQPQLNSNDDTNGNPTENASNDKLRGHGDGSDGEIAYDRQSSSSGLPLRSAGVPSFFRILPAMPLDILPNSREASKSLTQDSRSLAEARGDASSDPIAGADSKELLRIWLASANEEAQPIERELARRGFGRLSKPLVRQYFSDNPQDRIQLVDKVLTQPGTGSEAWLLLLAVDADSDVRLFAVTFMATSNNAALVEKAWQAAIRDHDPRVADLAGRLRERREGALRR